MVKDCVRPNRRDRVYAAIKIHFVIGVEADLPSLPMRMLCQHEETSVELLTICHYRPALSSEESLPSGEGHYTRIR